MNTNEENYIDKNESIEQKIINEIRKIKDGISDDDIEKLSKRGKLRLHKDVIRLMMNNDIKVSEQCNIINKSGIKVSVKTFRIFLQEEFEINNEYLLFLKRNGWYRSKYIDKEERKIHSKIFEKNKNKIQPSDEEEILPDEEIEEKVQEMIEKPKKIEGEEKFMTNKEKKALKREKRKDFFGNQD